MLARPVYVWHSCQQPFHCLLAFWFFIFSSTFPFWLLYHLVNIGWFRGGRWVTEARPQGLRLRTSSLPSRPCAKESRFVMWIFDKHSKNIHPGFSDPWTCPAPSSLSEDCCENIAKDCLLTGQEQACSRITRLFVCLFVCRHAQNGLIHRKMVVTAPHWSHPYEKPFYRPDRTRKEVQPVFCIVDTGSCLSENQTYTSLVVGPIGLKASLKCTEQNMFLLDWRLIC